MRLPGQAKAAFEKHGVTDFVVDSECRAGQAAGRDRPAGEAAHLRAAGRVAWAAPAGAVQQVWLPAAEEAAKLLKRVKASGAAPCLTFHVGSQCLSPFSYAQAIEIAQRTVRHGRRPDRGAGYRRRLSHRLSGQEPPPYHWYFDMIKDGAGEFQVKKLPVMCEPGRALVGQGISLVTQVVMRRGDRLYLNDGIYGSFDEQRFAGLRRQDYPPTAITLDAKGKARAMTAKSAPSAPIGPTCDSAPMCCRVPVMVPDSIATGDFVLFDAMGAYTVSSRSAFNGYYPDQLGRYRLIP